MLAGVIPTTAVPRDPAIHPCVIDASSSGTFAWYVPLWWMDGRFEMMYDVSVYGALPSSWYVCGVFHPRGPEAARRWITRYAAFPSYTAHIFVGR